MKDIVFQVVVPCSIVGFYWWYRRTFAHHHDGSLKEILIAIKRNINPKKAPGFDMIKGEILKQLAQKAIVKLTHLYNATYRLKYVPSYWKAAEMSMLPKPGKPGTEVTSYRPISLLPVLPKLLEKLHLRIYLLYSYCPCCCVSKVFGRYTQSAQHFNNW
jgi:hypothetical protein